MNQETSIKCIKFVMDDKKSVVPTKAHPSDIGYDLTAIGVYKVVSERVTLYETGIKVESPPGYYVEILPRSSISKTGYMLANSVGVIDPSYRGTLKIALIQVDCSFRPLELPFTLCQLVLRKAEYSDIKIVNSLNDTVRGDGGFGSSNK